MGIKNIYLNLTPQDIHSLKIHTPSTTTLNAHSLKQRQLTAP